MRRSGQTQKRRSLAVVLAVVFLLLIATIGWLELRPKPQISTTANDIQHIGIQRDGLVDIALSNENGQWFITSPYRLNANPIRIEPLLSLATISSNGYEPNQVDMPATGLLSSSTSITLNDTVIKLGNLGIDGERRYALIGKQVHLLPDWVWSLIHGGVTAFAELTVFAELPDDSYLISQDGSSNAINTENWKGLTADKIIPWPIEATQTNTAQSATLSKTAESAPEAKLADIVRVDNYTAVYKGGDYAYAIANDTFDAMLNR